VRDRAPGRHVVGIKPFAPCARIEVSDAFAGAAERGTGQTGTDASHSAANLPAVEGRKVVADKSVIQLRVFHARSESGRRCGVPLNVSQHTASVADTGESALNGLAELPDASGEVEDSKCGM
jgi:hypothetical protein